jgi:anti-sigma regulatory factor (Ser/Thr protein kinase)
VAEVRRILDADPEAGSVPFGRTQTDPGRLAAIARDRGADPLQLHRRAREGMATVATLLEAMRDDDWTRTGLHPTLGVMGMDGIMQRFLVGHLEEHADQLDSLAHAANGAG